MSWHHSGGCGYWFDEKRWTEFLNAMGAPGHYIKWNPIERVNEEGQMGVGVLDRLCATCGQTYGKHYGSKCFNISGSTTWEEQKMATATIIRQDSKRVETPQPAKTEFYTVVASRSVAQPPKVEFVPQPNRIRLDLSYDEAIQRIGSRPVPENGQ